MNIKYAISLFVLCITIQLFSFGKNKVQYHNFDWKCIQTKHFVIYYYKDGEYLAEFTAKTAEKSLKHIQRDFLYEPRQKINIIVYNSHNHFQETNTLSGTPEESVGGFTEFFKNRVVIPFQNNWEDFRHVIHHELVHAVQNQMLFGSNFSAIVSGLKQTQMPLWLVEGVAEYQSRGGWESDADMTIRDAVYNKYLPPVNYLNGYFAYKGGQNLLFYIAENYGSRKIGDIFRNISVFRSTEKAFSDALGLNYNKLSYEWQKWVEDKYRGDFKGKDEPDEISDRITNHLADGNFINVAPAISPDGKKIAYLSDKSDYFDIYLVRTFDGEIIRKIVSGQKGVDFEEFHWLTPGLSWSPDSKKICFSVKSGDNDILFAYEAETGREVFKKKFSDLDGILTPSWSPKGDKIVFNGFQGGFSNIYIYDIVNEKLIKVTDDVFSENNPKFSPSGNKLVFTSEREDDLEFDKINEALKDTLFLRNNKTFNTYILNLDNNEMQKITNFKYKTSYPFWIDNSTIGYISNETGVANIYKQKVNSENPEMITNLISGVAQADYSGGKLVFSSFFRAGYDIFMVNNISSLKIHKNVKSSRWYKETSFAKDPYKDKKYQNLNVHTAEINKIVFDRTFKEKYEQNKESDNSLSSGNVYKTGLKKYELKFSPDIIILNAGYATGYGFEGNSYMQFSDQLSNHQIAASFSLSYDFINSYVNLSYLYLKRRVNFGFGFVHNAVHYWLDEEEQAKLLGKDFNPEDHPIIFEDLFQDRLFSFYFMAQYPLSRFSRLDGNLVIRQVETSINTEISESDWVGIGYEYEHFDSNTLITTGFGYSFDNTVWGIVGPENGFRFRSQYTYAPNSDLYTSNNQKEFDFHTITFDARKYFRISGPYQFALRTAAGFSEGKSPQVFLLGGTSNWFGAEINDENNIKAEEISEKYYSSVVTPLRGYDIYEKKGNRFAILNAEFRFPLVNYLEMGFPFNLRLGYIRGVLFSDLGAAWFDDDLNMTEKDESGETQLKDLLYSGGMGARANLGIFILRYDIAWQYDFNNSASRAKHILSLGTNF